MSNMMKFAESELDIIGLVDDGDEMNGAMRKHILHMIHEFSKEGHSGFSANYAVNLLSKLLKYEPLTPLTGEDWEWTEYADGRFQNKRCSHCGFPDAKTRKYNWSQKTTHRRGTGFGKMKHSREVARRARNGYRSGTAPKPKPRKNV